VKGLLKNNYQLTVLLENDFQNLILLENNCRVNTKFKTKLSFRLIPLDGV